MKYMVSLVLSIVFRPSVIFGRRRRTPSSFFFTVPYPYLSPYRMFSISSAALTNDTTSTMMSNSPLSQQVEYMDSLPLATSSSFLSSQPPTVVHRLTAVYDDTDYIVINKPYNVRMDGDYPVTLEKLMPVSFPPPPPSPSIQSSSLSSSIIDKNGRTSASRLYYHHCHQLDYATSGCLLYAKSSDAAAAATMLFEERKTRKEYLALVYGHIVTIPQRSYNKGNQGILSLPSHIQQALQSNTMDSEQIIETYVTELKTNTASRKVGQTMEKRRKEIAIQNILPVRAPQVWYETLRTQLESKVADASNDGNENLWFTKIKKIGYGEMKYLARNQRTILLHSKPVDDRSDLWTKQEITLSEEIKQGLQYDHFLTLLETMDITVLVPFIASLMIKPTDAESNMFTDQNWASSVFDICLYLAYHDNLRYRNDRQSKRFRQENDKDELNNRNNDKVETKESTNVTINNSIMTKSPINQEKEMIQIDISSSLPPNVRTPVFLIDLPIGEVTADGSDFRMQIMENSDIPSTSIPTSNVSSGSSINTNDSASTDPKSPVPGIPRPALTLVRIEQYGYYYNQPVTKVLLTPISGRRHQLRLHMQSIGHPILGDDTYCYPYIKEQLLLPITNRCSNVTNYEAIMDIETKQVQRMMLHSYTLNLDFPWLISNLPHRAYKSARRWMMKRSKENGNMSDTSVTLYPLQAESTDPFVPDAEHMETLRWTDTQEILKSK